MPGQRQSPSQRTAREVIEDHLARRRGGDLDGDLRHNIDPAIVVLTGQGIWRGHSGVREQAQLLMRYSSADTFRYRDVVVDGIVGFMEWSADGGGTEVHDGADSYVVQDGRIVAQTIHYGVRRA